MKVFTKKKKMKDITTGDDTCNREFLGQCHRRFNRVGDVVLGKKLEILGKQ